jgi:hypothetical protein
MLAPSFFLPSHQHSQIEPDWAVRSSIVEAHVITPEVSVLRICSFSDAQRVSKLINLDNPVALSVSVIAKQRDRIIKPQ